MPRNRYLDKMDMARRGRGRDRAYDGHYPKYIPYVEDEDMRRDRSKGYAPATNYSSDPREHQEAYMHHSDYARGRRDYDMDYARGADYRNDYKSDYRRDYAYDMAMDYAKSGEHKYHEDLERWAEKLKRKDRFHIKKEDVIAAAKQIGVKFEEFTEEEFYVVYLMELTDHPQAYNDFRSYLARAKEWLEDDDIEVSPSEKLCIYMYEIVKGESLK